MGFLSPWFLAGIAVAGLPLWLHLLRKFKRTPQPFSSVMLFERKLEASSRHRRLRELLLLAFRVALLLLLAFAFANPFVKHTSAVAGRRTLNVIAIDHSFSMRYGRRMQDAKARAHAVVNALPGGSLVEVLAVDAHVQALTQPERGRAALHAAIDQIQPSDLASSFGEFARVLRVMDRSTGMRLDVHFIGDMQKTSMPPAFADLAAGPHTSLSLSRVGSGDPPNWAVDGVSAPVRVYSAARRQITAVIAGWKTPAASKTVSLLLDGKTLETKQATVPANGRVEVKFSPIAVPYGAHRGEVRIEPHDGLAGDDSFLFSIERSDPRKVLFLYAGGHPEEALYYKTAMASATGSGLVVETARLEQAAAKNLSQYAYVVLNDPGKLDPESDRALCTYVEGGGAVLIAAGARTAGAGHVPVSGDSVSFGRGSEIAGTIDKNAAALAGSADFKNVRFSRYASLSPKAGARVIARLSGGSPLLVQEHRGEGRVLIFAAPLDGSESDFPLHASYVPFVVQTGRYLAGEEDQPSSVAAGTPVQLRRTRSQGTAANVIGPGGHRELDIRQASTALSFDLDQDGFYQVQRATGARLLVAVDADRRESDLAAIPDDTLALWRNTGTAGASQSDRRKQQTRDRTFWRDLLLLALAAALLESIFGSRYLGRGREAS
ncbi:MAG: BatA domain-containing protein [Bryobacteraceae bacterium]